jgi:hypothetical protein
VFYVLLIGFRYEVGGDWGGYLRMYSDAGSLRLSNVVTSADPGYVLLNWIAHRVGGGVFLVNLICGTITVYGLILFVRRQPMAWLAMVVAVPYIIIVVTMGYTRQATALGFVFMALVAFSEHRLRKFVLLLVVAALFHKTAILLLPLGILANSRNRVWVGFWIGVTGMLAGFLMLREAYEVLWLSYVATPMASEGGAIRVTMNALPAVILLLFRRRLLPAGDEGRLWSWIAVLSLLYLGLVPFASTAVDRVALYFLPIQLFVYSRFVSLFSEKLVRTTLVVGISLGYGLVQWVWLTMAVNSQAWYPYQFYPLVVI